MVNFSFKGQGTIEYLVSIGVVVVISLVVVGLLITQTGSAVNVSSSASRVSQVSGLISVSEAVVGVDGNGLVTLMNNSGGVLTITKLSVSGNDSNYSGVSLSQGDERVFSLDSVGSGCSCIGFEGQTKTCEVVVYAESEYGLEKQFPVSVLVNCVSNATATNPSVVVQPVSGDEELALLPLVSFVSPTPLDGNRTANTSIDINVNITSAPDLNEFKFNWNDTNYTLYDDSLVLMMNFDNVSALDENSTNVTDVSKYKNNGTCSGGTCTDWNATGKYGGAYQFNASNNYIDAGDTSSLDIPNQMTLSAWISPNQLNAWPASNDIIRKSDDGGDRSYFLVLSPDGSLHFQVYQNGSSPLCDFGTTDIISLGNWSFASATFDGSDARIYVNGIEKANLHCPGTIYNSGQHLKIGGGHSNTWGVDTPFNGTIDEVRIYNRSLSADEIKQFYFSNFRKYDVNKWNFSSIPLDECPATGGTLTKVGEYCIHTFTSNGTFTVPSDLNADVLVVGGGGGGGAGPGGGGGAGGFRLFESLSLSSTSYSIIVGEGGAEHTIGEASSFGDNESAGGGNGAQQFEDGGSGGSGGGGAGYTAGYVGGAGNIPSTNPSQGNNGGNGTSDYATWTNQGGGGGSGATGGNATQAQAGNGGVGRLSSISGVSKYYAGGGGGGSTQNDGSGGAGGVGGNGGGGNGGATDQQPGTDGNLNTGGGGGGGGATGGSGAGGGAGGSGVVIVRYLKIAAAVGDYNYQVFVNDANVGSNQTEERIVTIFNDCPATGGTLTKVENYCINTFDNNGTFNIPSGNLSADVLVVAGGGGGGGKNYTNGGGGGGAGGVVVQSGRAIAVGAYTVTIGAGGAGAVEDVSSAFNGEDSVFDTITANGGGAGGDNSAATAGAGGSGGGGGPNTDDHGIATQADSGGGTGYGYDGGIGPGGYPYPSGGGGGAGEVGQTGSGTQSGNGGAGISSSITGSLVWYGGGGGGGGHDFAPVLVGTGGVGGGGTGGYPGIHSTGGGGGGALASSGNGYSGGSGIVIVSYPKVS